MPSSKIDQPTPPTRDVVPATRRLPYDKPVLRSISLVADQVLGVGCKQEPGIGLPLGATPVLGCIANNCKTIYGT
jgi:hypothetical protein